MNSELGKSLFCARCDQTLLDYFGNIIIGQTVCHSQIFMCNAILCWDCFKLERQVITLRGTNDLIAYRDLYRKTKAHFESQK